MTDPSPAPDTRLLALLAPAALVAVSTLAWLDWSRRERRLQTRTADRLR